MRNLAHLVLVAAVMAAAAACARQQRAQPGVPASATLSNPKIARILVATARKVRGLAPGSDSAALSTRMVHVNSAGEIQIYVHVHRLGTAIEQALRHAGASVERASRALRVYQAWVSPEALARIAAVPGVVRVTAPTYGFPRRAAPNPSTSR